MPLPDFLIIGVQKGGTTALHGYLSNHPHICFGKEKEPFFFNVDENFERGLGWYSSYFEDCRPIASPCLIGEATPLYYKSQTALKRIRRTLPGVQIIIMLRNPVDRAYSNYWWNVSRGTEDRSFAEAINTIDGYRRYIAKGYYAAHLRTIRRYFPKDALHISLTEQLNSDPGAVVDSITDFLGIPRFRTLDRPIQTSDKNVTRIPANRIGDILLYIYRLAKPHYRKFLRPYLPESVRSSVTFESVTHSASFQKGYPPLSADLRHSLEGIYQEDRNYVNNLVEEDLARIWW